MADPLVVELHPSTARSTNGSGDAVDVGTLRTLLELTLRVTAVSGTTPNLVVTVETSPDGTTGWHAIRTLAASTIKISEAITDGVERYVRVSWAVTGGTPSLTFEITGVAHVLYAGRRDLEHTSIPRKALEAPPDDDQFDASILEELLSATSDIEDALNTNVPLPLTAWPRSLTQRAVDIATYRIMRRRGYQPEGVDDIIRLDYSDAMKWVQMVAEKKKVPRGLVPAQNVAVQTSSGDPQLPEKELRRFSDNWGDFG